ncbi:hypothetical protein IID19_02170 [Patescibacteria group bacterium]|nr:hypothetical protein [Patescibacteria group bacterium]
MGKFFLILILSVLATIIVADETGWPAALLWSGLILNVMVAIIGGICCDDGIKGGTWYTLIVGTIILIIVVLVDIFVLVRVPLVVYWTVALETFVLACLVGWIPIRCNGHD